MDVGLVLSDGFESRKLVDGLLLQTVLGEPLRNLDDVDRGSTSARAHLGASSSHLIHEFRGFAPIKG